MATGRKPIPASLKVLRMSTVKAKKLLARQISAPGDDLETPPAWLTADQKADWSYAVANAPAGVLRNIDRGILAGYIVAADTHRRAAVAMQTTALLFKAGEAAPQQNPYLPIVNRQMVNMIRGAAELGFTPCARARIENAAANLPKPEISDGWEDVG